MDEVNYTLGEIVEELKEANIILHKVVDKYGLKWGDIELSPLKNTISLSIMVSNDFDTRYILPKSLLQEDMNHTKTLA